MKYLETKIYTTTAGTEPVAALLMRHGIYEISIADSADMRTIVEAKEWLGWDYLSDEISGEDDAGEAVVTFYTEDTEAGRSNLAKIKIALMALKGDEQYGKYGACADFGRLYAESEPLDDEWKTKWKEGFRPFKATERIAIKPTWDDGEETFSSEDIVISIDPGMAFGTGAHETTSMCLAALDRSVKPGMSVLDIGAGSGILSIAAVKLGAGSVTAVEYDSDAAAVSVENFWINDVANSVELIRGDIMDVEAGLLTYDIIVCNLTSGLVGRIAPKLAAHLTFGCMLIVSGILVSEKDAVTRTLRGAGFDMTSIEEKGEWMALCARVL